MANGHIGTQRGNYRLTRLLGRSAFAEVYLGEHIYASTPAAIKIFQQHIDVVRSIEDFRREVQVISALTHPHILPILEADCYNEHPFLVMEYIAKGSLRTLYPQGTRVPLSTIITHVKQLAGALQYAHDAKRIHRNVKPENMLIDDYKNVLLSDFSLVTIAHSLAAMDMPAVASTLCYTAPEQLQGIPCPASDQYALAAVVYEWISGISPFLGSTPEVIGQHFSTPPRPLRETTSAISPHVEQVILKALAKDPRQRFPTVQAFASVLEQAYHRSFPSHYGLAAEIPLTKQAPPIFWEESRRDGPPGEQYPPFSGQSLLSIEAPISGGKIRNEPTSRRFSRRTVVLGLIGLTVAGGVINYMASVEASNTLYIYTGHSGPVGEIGWSPDGQRIASGSDDMTLQIWDALDGKHALICKGHSDGITGVAWSPDGTRIVSGSRDTTAIIWNTSDGSNLFVYNKHPNIIQDMAWSPDGQSIATAYWDDHTVQIWGAEGGNDLAAFTGHADHVDSIRWSSDSTRIVSSGADTTVQIWNASDGSRVFVYKGHTQPVVSAVWSPNDLRIASGGFDTTVQIWNASDGSNVVTYGGHSDIVNAIAWSPDGRRIASASTDKTVQVWNASDGGDVFTYRGHADIVYDVRWSPDGKRIASASRDGTVHVWRPR